MRFDLPKLKNLFDTSFINTYLLAVIFEGGLLILAIILGFISGFDFRTDIKVTFSSAMVGGLSTLPLLLIFIFLHRLNFAPLNEIKEIVKIFIQKCFPEPSIIKIAFLSIIAGVSEELLFRGVIQEFLTAKLNYQASVIITNVVFGLCHLITPLYSILAALIGFYMSALLHYTGNLFCVMITHAFYDFSMIFYLTKIEKQGVVQQQ